MGDNCKHVLVTGGAGFIGSHLTRRLLSEGREVTVIDDLSNGKRKNVPQAANFFCADLTDESVFRKLEQIPFDAVFHLAAQTSGERSFADPTKDMKSHLPVTFHVIRLCLKKQIARFIYASSTTIYGNTQYLPVDEKHPQNPKTFYAVGKAVAESYIDFFGSEGLTFTILRLPNVYGPGQNLQNKDQGMVSIYLSYILENQPILVKGSKDRFRDFIYIDDVVDGWMMAFEKSDAVGKTYNLASGKKSTVEQVLNALKSACGKPAYPIEFTDGTPGDQLGMVADISKIHNEIGFKPKVDLREGLQQTYEIETTK